MTIGSSAGTVFLEGFTIQNGTGTVSNGYSNGGGILITYASPIIRNCIIRNNVLHLNNTGGGIFASGGNPTIENCEFYGNASHWGSGMYVTQATVRNSVFHNNGWPGGAWAGGIHMDRGLVENSIFYDNWGQGSAIRVYRGSPTIRNCTFVNNGFELIMANPVIQNSILRGPIYNYNNLSNPQITFTNITGGWAGVGNIDADPQFVDAANHDYRLEYQSPCIDTGDPNSTLPVVDIKGTPRPQNGLIDMGAYELEDFVPPVTEAKLTGTLGANNWYTSDVTVTLTATDASGVREIRYAVDGSEAVIPGTTATVVLSAENISTFTFFAVDIFGTREAPQSLTVAIDKTAPVTTPAISGTAGTNGWYRSPVTVSLTAGDNASGVAGIYYNVDSGPVTVSGNSASMALSTDGIHTITYYAVDVAGNVESPKSLTVKIDQTPPSVTVAADPNKISPNKKLKAVMITGTAADVTSGIATIAITVTDRSGTVVATATAFNSTVQLRGTKDELYTVAATVTDKSGNSITATTTVSVK